MGFFHTVKQELRRVLVTPDQGLRREVPRWHIPVIIIVILILILLAYFIQSMKTLR
jgi:rRNA-processing protein FCF1